MYISNKSSKVPGNRDLGWQDENPSVNKTQKSVATHSDVENVDGSESMEAHKREERRKRKEKDICLTSYTAWCKNGER